MPRTRTATARPRRPSGRRRRTYHHGNLRQALVEATLKLAEEAGPESVSVREAARRAGVSPGAPFRHFADRTALMTAVAEEAMRRLHAEIDTALAADAAAEPLERLRAIGDAYLRWVARNPMHFQIISTRRLIDFDGSPTLGPDNDRIQDHMDALLREADARGDLRSKDLARIQLSCKALVYGLARMHIDGHFPSWRVASADAEPVMHDVLGLFLASLRR
jgi:AcrR family transcriptional regulator